MMGCKGAKDRFGDVVFLLVGFGGSLEGAPYGG